MLSIKYILPIVCIVLMSSCGGGDKGDGTSASPIPDSSASSISASGLIANAGDDMHVYVGQKVVLNPNAAVVGASGFKSGQGNLEVTGASNNPNDIVSIAWTYISGPAVSLESSSTTSAVVSFTAPSIGVASQYLLRYKLTVTTASGKKAVDTVNIYIEPPYLPPSVNLGFDQAVEGLTPVSLTAMAADSNGLIASYTWVQTSGPKVEFDKQTTGNRASFIAPSTTKDLTLTFEVTVKDNEGFSATDSVIVKVTPENAPRLQLYFPPAVGIFKDTTITASGLAIAKSGSISSVSVDVGKGPIAATLNNDGSWMAKDLVVPTGIAEFNLSVTATDTSGLVTKVNSTLKTTGDRLGARANELNWSETIGFAIDSKKNIAYVLADGASLNNLRLFSIDLATGNQGPDISNFSDLSKGINSSAVTAMVYDDEKNKIYVSISPANATKKPQILSINTVNGERNLVSDNTRGKGDNLIHPTGLAMGANNTLYVADNVKSTIVAIDTVTGDRTSIASSATLGYPIDAPLLLASDITSTNKRLFMIPNVNSNYVLALDLTANPVSSTLITNSSNSSQGSTTLHSTPQGIVVAPKLGSLFVNDQIVNSQIVQVNLTNGYRTKLTATEATGSRISFDTQKQLLYLIDGITPGLYVGDPITAQKALISRY